VSYETIKSPALILSVLSVNCIQGQFDYAENRYHDQHSDEPPDYVAATSFSSFWIASALDIVENSPQENNQGYGKKQPYQGVNNNRGDL